MSESREDEIEELLLLALRALLEALRAELELIDRVLVERERGDVRVGAELRWREARDSTAPGPTRPPDLPQVGVSARAGLLVPRT